MKGITEYITESLQINESKTFNYNKIDINKIENVNDVSFFDLKNKPKAFLYTLVKTIDSKKPFKLDKSTLLPYENFLSKKYDIGFKEFNLFSLESEYDSKNPMVMFSDDQELCVVIVRKDFDTKYKASDIEKICIDVKDSKDQVYYGDSIDDNGIETEGEWRAFSTIQSQVPSKLSGTCYLELDSKGKVLNAKDYKINNLQFKAQDECRYTVYLKNGMVLQNLASCYNHKYVPSFVTDEWGDYLHIDIDSKGYLESWTTPKSDELTTFLKELNVIEVK